MINIVFYDETNNILVGLRRFCFVFVNSIKFIKIPMVFVGSPYENRCGRCPNWSKSMKIIGVSMKIHAIV